MDAPHPPAAVGRKVGGALGALRAPAPPLSSGGGEASHISSDNGAVGRGAGPLFKCLDAQIPAPALRRGQRSGVELGVSRCAEVPRASAGCCLLIPQGCNRGALCPC
jgi:hypothetical protein